MKKILLISVAFATIFAFSCKTTNETSKTSTTTEKENVTKETSMNIEGEWKLSKFIVNGTEKEIFDATLVVQKNEDGSYLFAGNSGVNQYSGNVTIDKFGNLVAPNSYASTKMMGEPEKMEFEDEFLRVLSFVGKINVEKLSENCVELLDVQSESKMIFVK